LAKTGVKTKSKSSNVTSPYKDKTFLLFIALQVLFATCFFSYLLVPLYFKEGLQLKNFNRGGNVVKRILIALVEMVLFKLEGKGHILY
jgi:hypothetical protein